jgi:hypothetical protein
MEPPPELEAEFNDWYETEHIPVRLALPGFSGAVRYIERGGERRYLAVYEIGDLAVLETPAYQLLKTAPSARTALMLKSVKGFTRFTCTEAFDSGALPARGKHLEVAAFAVPPSSAPEFDERLREAQRRLPTQVGGGVRTRHYKVFSADGGPWTDLVLYELTTLDNLTGAQGPGTSVTSDTGAFASEPWFQAAGRWLYDVRSEHYSRA